MKKIKQTEMKNQKEIKKSGNGVLFWATGVIALIAVVAIVGLVFVSFEHRAQPKVVAVSGQCLTTVPKDRTAITLRVTTLDKNAATSMRQARDQMVEITDFLKTQDVKMQTTEFNSYEKTEWNRDLQKSITLGIETTIAVEVSADSIEKIEDVLEKFAGQKNVFSENLRMYTSAEKMKDALEKCLGVAVKDARTRAKALANGDKKKVGELLSVSYDMNTMSDHQPRLTNFARMPMAKEGMKSALDMTGTIMAKDTEVSVGVSAVFQLK